MATTGINTNKVGTMQQEMEQYMKTVKNKVNIEAVSSVIERAIQGSRSEDTLKAYARAVDREIDNFVEQLKQYESQLSTVKSTYIRDDSSNATFTNAQKNL